MRCPSPRHDGVSDPSSDNIVRMTPESYSAGLSLLKFTLPLLREQVGRHAFHQLLILHPTIHQACRFMEAHFNQGELHLNDVATHCGVSSDWLTRHFRKSMKLTIPGYLSWLRIEHVSRLLETSDHQITEICFESGFSSVSQFNRVFKSLKGVSPSEYRAKL